MCVWSWYGKTSKSKESGRVVWRKKLLEETKISLKIIHRQAMKKVSESLL